MYIMASTALEIFITEFVLLGTSLKHPLCCAYGENPDPQIKQVSILKLQRIAQKWEIGAA